MNALDSLLLTTNVFFISLRSPLTDNKSFYAALWFTASGSLCIEHWVMLFLKFHITVTKPHKFTETWLKACRFIIYMWLIFIVSSEVTVPVSMQEVAGYIEKQVAYLSGGVFSFCLIVFGDVKYMWINGLSKHVRYIWSSATELVLNWETDNMMFIEFQGDAVRTLVSSSLSQNSLLSAIFLKKLWPKFFHTSHWSRGPCLIYSPLHLTALQYSNSPLCILFT